MTTYKLRQPKWEVRDHYNPEYGIRSWSAQTGLATLKVLCIEKGNYCCRLEVDGYGWRWHSGFTTMEDAKQKVWEEFIKKISPILEPAEACEP